MLSDRMEIIMSYDYSKFKRVCIFSNSRPLDGQKERCSKNFRLNEVKVGSGFYLYFPFGIMFDIKVDRSLNTDDTLCADIKMPLPRVENGEVKVDEYFLILTNEMKKYADSVYIANVRSIDENGTIKAFSEDICFKIVVSYDKTSPA